MYHLHIVNIPVFLTTAERHERRKPTFNFTGVIVFLYEQETAAAVL